MGQATMGIETEAKLKVVSHDPLRARLVKLGARRLGRVLESNHVFDDAARSLLAGDRGLRVRRIDALDGAGRPATLTYKGPRDKTLLKQRQEIEVSVGDADAARTLLAALGFVEVLCFQKRRESWILDACRVELDELPHLGTYVEVEGPGPAEIQAALTRLGLADEPVVPASYIALLVDCCKAHALPVERIEFPKG
jgi:adenylate cyclase, class 2